MKCLRCGFDNPADTVYCGKCGTKFGAAADISVTKTLRTPTKEFLIGRTIAGKYETREEIGRGGMGIVYKGEDLKLKRPVALKFLPRELMADPEAEERFTIEARAAAALSHPNICTIYEVGEAEERPFIAMEFVDGESLREKIKRGRLGIDEFLEIAVQAAEGLNAAHLKGIIHRDIKSANIMLTRDGQAKIMDFGLAKVHGGTSLTQAGAAVGTVAYMSPEQARGEKVDERTDIWSLGVVFYELLTGELPFRGDQDASILYSVVHEEPKPLKDLKPPVPPELEQVIGRALKKNPEARYPSAAEMLKDLRRYMDALKAEKAGFFNLRSLVKRLRRPAVAIPAVLVLAGLVFLAVRYFNRQAKIRWANDVAIPEIERLLTQSDTKAVFRLALQAEKVIPQSPKLKQLWPLIAGSRSFVIEPSGADVFIKDYEDPKDAWEYVGRSPVENFRTAQGYKHWKAEREGFESVEGTFFISPGSAGKFIYALDEKGKIPPGMVRVEGWTFRPVLFRLGSLGPVKLDDYFLDKYEVTNRQYKEFLESGAYRKRDHWKQPFLKNGRVISWEEAMKEFVDKTGRPGPATWLLGDYPEGQADYAVSGISWYEAAAYAEYAGKSLPTVYHWDYASGESGGIAAGYIVRSSNFSGRGPAAVGSLNSLCPFGSYDMAGNVKEWCWNETGGKRFILGGAWNEQQYMFGDVDSYDPFRRDENFGFRCLKYLPGKEPPPETLRPMELAPLPDYSKKKPCSDEVFGVYQSLYAYTKTDLDAKVESQQEWSEDTTLEKVSFIDANGEDRMLAYLFIPRRGKPPFPAVIHFPASSAWSLRSIFDYWVVKNREVELFTKSGRAFVLPVFNLTFDRLRQIKFTSQVIREGFVRWYRETGLCLDYLETRPEFDREKFVCEGISSGTFFATIFAAMEKRFKAAVLLGGGLWSVGGIVQGQAIMPEGVMPEFDMFNFAPRVKIPVLMLNGRYDFQFPLETNVRVLFDLLGTPKKDKFLRAYETGHSVWFLNEYRKDMFDFLDKYAGPLND